MSGPKILPNGDVISNALSYESPFNDSETLLYGNLSLELGQIVAVYDAESTAGLAKGMKPLNTISYDVVITTMSGAVELIPRCRMMQPTTGGSFNNFHELLPVDPGGQGKRYDVKRSLKRGTYVLVGFINGDKRNGVILGAMPHDNEVATKRRPKKSRGAYVEGEFQGLNYSIDNDGALKITMNGPRDDKGVLINQNGPTTVEIDKTGNINISNNNKQKVTINRVSGHIRVDAGPTYIDMDQKADKIDVVAKNVNVGTGGLQPQVVGDDWQKIMEELITEIMALYVPTGVGPSGNPVNNPKFAAIKAKLSDALSKKHKVEK